MILQHVLHYAVFGNTIERYVISGAIFIGLLLIIVMVKQLCVGRLKKMALKTPNTFDDVLVDRIEKNGIPLFIVLALYTALQNLNLSISVHKIFYVGMAVITVYFIVRFLLSLVVFGFERRRQRIETPDSQRQLLKAMQIGIQVVIWTLAGIILIDNLGIKISALVAGLGIGGIAVALASQILLGDLFAYIIILIDRPFEIGDFIIVNDFMGTIEYVGIKSTRIRSLDGELLIFHNSDLTNARIRNFNKMKERRVLFSFGVTYGTSLSDLKKIPALIAAIIQSIPNTRFDRAHFKEFADSSLNYEVVYHVLSPDYNLYMDILQEINFRIRAEFDRLSIEFAFPTRTLYLSGAADTVIEQSTNPDMPEAKQPAPEGKGFSASGS